MLDAAAKLFAEHGTDAVSLRQVASEADVQLALISRYIGTRHELVTAVLEDLSAQVAHLVAELQTGRQSFDRDSALGRWTRVLAHVVLTTDQPPTALEYNPVLALAEVAVAEYGLDDQTARRRAAQVVASALGWRIFEDYLVGAGDLGEVPLEELRDDLHRMHQRLAATPLVVATSSRPGTRRAR